LPLAAPFSFVLSPLRCCRFSPEAYAAHNFDVFGAPSFAASGGYLDGSTKGFVLAVRTGAAWPGCGVDDAQANCVARLPPMVAAFAGDAALLPAVANMIRVTQNSDAAVAWGTAAARVLEKVILGETPAAAVSATIAALQVRCWHIYVFVGWCEAVPLHALGGILTHSAPVCDEGSGARVSHGARRGGGARYERRGCAGRRAARRGRHTTGPQLPPARRTAEPHACACVRPSAGHGGCAASCRDGHHFAGALRRGQALPCASVSQAPTATTKLRRTQGGCNASRAGFVGACFGAAHGPDAVPPAWRAKFMLYEETLERAHALAALRG
jgi:hypothetical protein